MHTNEDGFSSGTRGAYLSFNGEQWSVIVQGMPSCAPTTLESAKKVATAYNNSPWKSGFFKPCSLSEYFDGLTGEWKRLA